MQIQTQFRRSALFGGLMLCWFLLAMRAAGAPPVRKMVPGGEEWTIDEPPIDRPLTSLREIEVAPGDVVSVTADGCADRGGYYDGIAFRTTYDYVFPRGGLYPDAGGALYNGTINIPGGTGGTIRVAEAIAMSPFPIRSLWCDGRRDEGQVVSLGYNDNEYPDNSYNLRNSHHDQCSGKGPAKVVITILKGAPPPPPPPARSLDLVFAGLEPNGLPLNPAYFRPFPPAKTLINDSAFPGNAMSGTPNFDYSDLCLLDDKLNAIGTKQHVNLRVVTVEGKISFTSRSAEDGDVNFDLVPAMPAALTNGATDRYLVELHPRDSFNSFRSTFWKVFLASPNAVLDRQAVGTGELGLDNAHAAWSEIHPLFALAMLRPGPANADFWDLFIYTHARAENLALWGSPKGGEGYCSQFPHFLDPTLVESGNLARFAFTLPWKVESGRVATGVEILPIAAGDLVDAFGNPVSAPVAQRCGNRLILSFFWNPVMFPMGDPKINGTVGLRWTF